MLDVDRQVDAVYLHFLDRELNAASGLQRAVHGAECVRMLRLLSLLTSSDIVCGLSALWESEELGPESCRNLDLHVSQGELSPISHASDVDVFLEGRRSAYEHDRARYGNYFSENADLHSWARPARVKSSGSTGPLATHLYGWAEEVTSDAQVAVGFGRLRDPVLDALRYRDGRAITMTLFEPHLGDLASNAFLSGQVRRQISYGFTLDYLHKCGADIASGVRGLSWFDRLARAFPRYDIVLLGEMAALLGLSNLCDPRVTSHDAWAPYLFNRRSREAYRLSERVSILLECLGEREKHRLPSRADDPGEFGSISAQRRRAVSAIRQSAYLGARLAPPPDGADPQVTFAACEAQLIWLSGELSARDVQLGVLLEEAEGRLFRRSVDILLVTVTDIETEALRSRLESTCGEGQPQWGKSNVYWIYDVASGVSIAHVRSSMGAMGQGGSTLTVSEAIGELQPSSVIAIGLAFGVDETKQPLGQLLLSQRLTMYEPARLGEKDGALVRTERGQRVEASARLLGRFRDARLDKLGIDVNAGEMLSGEKLIDNALMKEELLSRFPDAIGGEMEGSGIYAAAGRDNVDWLVVKAVCDYAENKGQDKKERQSIAAAIAADAFMHVLSMGALARR